MERYDGANASLMLQPIMRPKTFPQDAGGFEVALNEWEHLVQRWEILTSDLLNDAVKRQILLDMAPSGIRVELTLAGHQSYETFMSYLVASRDWDVTAGTPSSDGAPPVPMEVAALTPPLRKSKDGNGSGNKSSGKTPQKPADGKPRHLCGKTGHYARDCWQRQGLSEGKSDGKGKGKSKGKSGGKGEGKANNIADEQSDGEQHVDPGIVDAVTRDEWIMVLEREAPQTDLDTNNALMGVLSLCELLADMLWPRTDIVFSSCKCHRLKPQPV